MGVRSSRDFQPSFARQSQNYFDHAPEPQRKLGRRHSRKADYYNTLEQVIDALACLDFESSNLIVGIDFTKSNEWTGARSFNRRSLHQIGHGQNPYEQAISTVGNTFSAFNKDNLIPCFGFGDASTYDRDVFSFYPDERSCNGFEEVLSRYREIVPDLRLAGPTSFAPIIEMGMTIVEQSGGQYHVLLIIADGQVTKSLDFGTQPGQSPQEQKTVKAIVKASEYPLSIILVGVGDGPWDMMKEFIDDIPARAFDNFQFVNFTEIMSKNVDLSRKQAEFALTALMEIPSQYKATLELNLLGSRRGTAPDRVPLPPPRYGATAYSSSSKPYHEYGTTTGTAPPASSAFDNQVTNALARACLESSNLIVGIDFTKSNEWTGKHSFNRQSLHCIGHNQNPYEQAISTIGKTLSAFDTDNLIPCFGFGDASTHDQDVFSFYQDERFCNGFEEVLRRYREIVPELQLSGPTSFAPMIEMGMTIVEQSGGQYHVLLIIADGEVTKSQDFGTQPSQLSRQEQKTVEAIIKASEYSLSIIVVGVGDGPWDMMKEFVDNIPARAFDNFQFVNFTEIMSKNVDLSRKQAEFALAVLMEIPSQYKATLELNLLGSWSGTAPDRVPLPPPRYGATAYSSSSKSYHEYDTTTGTAPPANSDFDNQVTTAFARTGLESSNLIVGIDFTKSNEWTGKYSFNRQSLHCIGHNQNPYEQAISTIGKTLSAFDKDDLIPCFGFGDESTHDQDVFSFYPNERFCNGFEEVLRRYREIVPELQLKEPTSFAPMIEMGMTIVEQSGGLFHVLLIIADGQVTRSPDFGTQRGQRSPQEQKTVEAIVKASEYPLSIILVGVGDGPWDMMKEFEDNIPARAFDNFQFVNFTKIMSKNVDLSRKQTEFALAALMKIPSQYKATLELNLLGSRSGTALDRVPLPPPLYGAAASSSSSKPLHSSSFQNSAPPDHEYDTTTGTAPHASSAFDNQVTDPLAHVGLKSSNLIVGIDFTKSNEWTGARSFNRQSLHHIGHGENPYEQAISIIGKTLSAFDGDNLIPCFGFGDASTHDQDVFSFYPGERFCNRFEEVLSRYREIVPELRLSGPTSFAPMIEMGMTIVEQSGGQYHVLLIISDGQRCQLSPQEQKTIKAIVKASEYPLSIIVVGVGDGPWDMMKEFNDTVPARAFDNFQFVNFTEIMSKNVDLSRKQTEFVLATLMEIPAQYKATLELNLLGSRKGKAPYRVPLPPPLCGAAASFSSSKPFHSSSFQKNAPPGHGYGITIGKAPPASSAFDNQVCPVCLSNPKDTAFGCGHQVVARHVISRTSLRPLLGRS